MEPPPIKRCSHRAFWLIIVLLSLLLLVSLAVNTSALFGMATKLGTRQPSGRGVDEFPDLAERWSYGEGPVTAARIPIRGLIMRESGHPLFGSRYDKIEGIRRQIRAAGNDPQVQAIILEIESPGGAITPSDELYQELKRFKASDPDRKVVVHMKDLAASGAYYIAVAGDCLIAEPTAIVGSIGVIMQTLNWKELTEKIGLRDTTIKSGENKDLLNPFRDVSTNQVALLQEVIDSLHARFVGIVQEERGIEPERLAGLADGRIFTAETALENDLIDEIGYWDDVVTRTAELLGEPSVTIIRYEQTPELFTWLAEIRSPLRLSSWLESGIPRIMYLWRP